jgi:hypothetical protein
MLWLAFCFEKRRIQLKKFLPVVLLAIALFSFALGRPALAAEVSLPSRGV